MINLNDNSFDAKEVSIFNGGKAGLVENVTLDRIIPKGVEDKENAPDFKIFFKDESGKDLSFGMYVVDTDREYGEKNFKKQATLLKHFAHAFVSPTYSFPPYDTTAAMLSGVLGTIRDSINHSVKYRIYTNYGTTMKVSNFIGLRSWPACVELMTVPLADTKLKASTIEVLERATADESSTNGTPAAAATPVSTDW
jgi:hypothetical protein